jgi:hypothetical protein
MAIGVTIWYIKSSRPTPGLVFQPYSRNKATVLGSGSYDPLRFKLFADSLSALCLGAGLDAPPMFVARFPTGDIPMALAFCADMGEESSAEIDWDEYGGHIELKIEQPALVITEQLLEADLTSQEIEAIVADLLAKLCLNPFEALRGGTIWVGEHAKKLAFDPGMLERAMGELGYNAVALAVLLQDAWAARLTGQPGALKTAIQKSRDLLGNTAVSADIADPFIFVDPPHAWDFSGDIPHGKGVCEDPTLTQRAAISRKRELIMRLRLESLKKIERGVRTPGAEVRGTRTVVRPDYWE